MGMNSIPQKRKNAMSPLTVTFGCQPGNLCWLYRLSCGRFEKGSLVTVDAPADTTDMFECVYRLALYCVVVPLDGPMGQKRP